MKKLLKPLVTVLICSVSISASAQNLISKISDQASFVLAVNGQNTFKDVSVLDIEKSLLFKEVTKELFRRSEFSKPSNFADMGVNVTSKMYVAIENQKDMTYYYYTCAIQDLTKFDGFVKSGLNPDDDTAYSKTNGLSQLVLNNTSRLVWNESYFIFIVSTYTGKAYESDYYRSWNDYGFENVETTEATIEFVTETDHDVVEEVYEIQEEEVYQEEMIEVVEEMDYDSNQNYESEYAKKQRQKKEAFEKIEALKRLNKKAFIDSALTARTTLFFTDYLTTSFTPTRFDENAVASIWYNGMSLSNLPNPFTRMLYGYGRGSKNTRDFLGLQHLYNAEYYTNLYLEEDRISLKSTAEFSDNLKESANKIYNSKLDKKFCNYLPENPLAYSSFSISTADLLTESATISKDYFEKSSDFKYSEEVSVYIDLLQIMLDEEAIAELVTGDVVMLLNDLSSKQVEYKTWEYDENFNESQVTKTKNELLPEFTFMMGSQNEEMLTKLFKLSMKHKFLSEKESYFVASEKYKNELPFDMFICFKDGILFMTNSKAQLKDILNGKVEHKINRTQRKHIMKNIGTFYLDMEQITSKLLADEAFSKELSELNDFKEDIKQIQSTSTYKNGVFNMNAYITIPEGEANSSAYLLQLVDKIIAKN